MRIFQHSLATAPAYPPLVRLYDIQPAWNPPSPSFIYDPLTGQYRQAVVGPTVDPRATNPRAGRRIQWGSTAHQRTIWN
jgi:hypothetical protein